MGWDTATARSEGLPRAETVAALRPKSPQHTFLGRLLRFVSRISIRLLAFNLLVVFLPILGILSLKIYEDQLLELQERSMVQQGRILAAALGGEPLSDGSHAERILINLEQQVDARLRVFDPDGQVLADSSRLGPRRESLAQDPGPSETATRDRWIYRLGTFLYRGLSRLLPPEPPTREVDPEVAALIYRVALDDALAGSYRATTVPTPNRRSLTMYSALPIRDGDRVAGAVLVSKTTYQILSAIYDFRLAIFKVVLASVVLAVILTLLVSTTIERPLRRLRTEALAIVDRRGRLRGRFKGSRRLDEIGDLSRALAELTRQLEGHIEFIESFASDVSHEFKNPLAAIRTSTELLLEVDQPEQRKRFIDMILRDIARLEHLLSGVQEITRLDARRDAPEPEPVAVEPLLRSLVERYEMSPDRAITYHLEPRPSEPVVILGNPEHLAQVLENLLDNATSFAPPESEIDIAWREHDSRAVVEIRDRGPGIPDAHRERVFDRFFSYRPKDSSSRHTGLGLAIVRTLLEGMGGNITSCNHPDGGAVFTLDLPIAENP